MPLNRSLAIALAGVAALSSAQLQLTTFASGFSNPIAIIADPDSASRFFVVQQRGLIRIVENGSVLPGNFLDVSTLIATGGERGLLGMAFDPAHATNRYFYLNFTETSTGATRIVRYTRSNATTADAASRFDLLRIPQPFTNHNGGTIAFGDDGFLYIGMGDGGSANDPNNAAQTTSSLLGKMLRIDVNGDDFPTDNARNYRIPPSNPFLDGVPVTASGEIWAFGVRNPWKWSFDRKSLGGLGAMLMGDVGQNQWEEVNYEPFGAGGRNYGWRMREGAHSTGLTGSAYTPWVDPIVEYSHAVGGSITGGFVYRGNALGPDFYGRYFFADYISGRVWSVFVDVDPATGEGSASDLREHTSDLTTGTSIGNVSSFGVDRSGELFIVGYGGTVYRLAPEGDLGNELTAMVMFGGNSNRALRDRFVLDVRAQGSTTPLHRYTMSMDEVDAFRCPVPARTIDVSIKPGSFLRRTVSLDATSGDVHGMFEMVNGDVNGDNTINISDFLALRQAFGTSAGGPADLNGDGSVNVADFLILRANFGRTGDQ
ncbi:MAG: hypothetical protein AMXMBFR81_01350 [Chthonomonas sp.]